MGCGASSTRAAAGPEFDEVTTDDGQQLETRRDDGESAGTPAAVRFEGSSDFVNPKSRRTGVPMAQIKASKHRMTKTCPDLADAALPAPETPPMQPRVGGTWQSADKNGLPRGNKLVRALHFEIPPSTPPGAPSAAAPD